MNVVGWDELMGKKHVKISEKKVSFQGFLHLLEFMFLYFIYNILLAYLQKIVQVEIDWNRTMSRPNSDQNFDFHLK